MSDLTLEFIEIIPKKNILEYKRNCPNCNKEIYYKNKLTLNGAIKRRGKCKKCANILTQNYRVQKQSQTKKGKPTWSSTHKDEMSKKISGINNPYYGKKLSNEHRKKISISTKEAMANICKEKKDLMIKKQNISLEKSKYQRKPYILPNGETVLIQGFENITLDKLFKEGIQLNNLKIKVSEKPKIKYFWNDSEHWYYPDCYLVAENCIVETKSNYTWSADLERNEAKLKACRNEGYNVRLIIWGRNNQLISDIIYNPILI